MLTKFYFAFSILSNYMVTSVGVSDFVQIRMGGHFFAEKTLVECANVLNGLLAVDYFDALQS